jgi:hypothetical protein
MGEMGRPGYFKINRLSCQATNNLLSVCRGRWGSGRTFDSDGAEGFEANVMIGMIGKIGG